MKFKDLNYKRSICIEDGKFTEIIWELEKADLNIRKRLHFYPITNKINKNNIMIETMSIKNANIRSAIQLSINEIEAILEQHSELKNGSISLEPYSNGDSK